MGLMQGYGEGNRETSEHNKVQVWIILVEKGAEMSRKTCRQQWFGHIWRGIGIKAEKTTWDGAASWLRLLAL